MRSNQLNRIKLLLIGVLSLFVMPFKGQTQGFFTDDTTFLMGKYVWFIGDTLDGHVEIHFDSSVVKITDLAAWIDSVRTGLFISANIVLADSEAVLEGFLDHDDLQGFVGNEHIDWTTDQGATNIHTNNYVETGDISSVIAGTGLTGGGTAGDATVNVIPSTGMAVTADSVKINLQANPGLVSKVAGLALGTPSDVTGASTNSVTTTTHTHAIGDIEEKVEDYIGGMVTGNTETGIAVTYEDGDGTLDFVAVDQSATNEIEVVDEAYSSANFNGGTTSAVSQDDFYDYAHIADTDDDGKPQVVDLSSAGFVKTDASGNLSSDTNTYLTAEVDGSTTNEIEVVDETYNATNFNGGTASAVSQDDFYDYNHIADTDDDGKPQVVDLSSLGFVKTDASGNLSSDTNTYLTSASLFWDAGTGTEIYYDETGGNVGIGIADPAYLLDVDGDARISNLYMESGATRYIYGPGSTYDMTIVGNATTAAVKVAGGDNWRNGADFEFYGSSHASRPGQARVYYGDYDSAVSGEYFGIYHWTESSGEEIAFKVDDALKGWFYGNLDITGTITNATWNGDDVDISSYTNLTASYTIYLSGDDLTFRYEPTEFELDGEGYMSIKDGVIDTAKVNDTQFYQYIEDHSASLTAKWMTEWVSLSSVRLDGTYDPSWYKLGGNEEIEVLEFDGVVTSGQEQELQYTFTLPSNYVTGSNFYFEVSYYPGGTTTSDVVWQIDYCVSSVGVAYEAVVSKTIVCTASMTNLYRYASGTSSCTGSGLQPETEIHAKFSRQPNDASDTYTGDMYLSKVGIRYQVQGFGDTSP